MINTHKTYITSLRYAIILYKITGVPSYVTAGRVNSMLLEL